MYCILYLVKKLFWKGGYVSGLRVGMEGDDFVGGGRGSSAHKHIRTGSYTNIISDRLRHEESIGAMFSPIEKLHY